MAEQLNQFTRRIKTFYELIYNNLLPGTIGIDDFLFPVKDIDPESSNFALDTLVKEVHGVVFRKRGEQSVVRPYEPGVGNIYEVPRTSEKTPIDERLRDAVIAGGEETESMSSRQARLLSQIIMQHTVAHATTRWKLAIDVIRTGKFSPYGLDGNDIGLEIDLQRDASLDDTYDFTVTGANINEALSNLYSAYRAMNGAGDELCVIMGDNYAAMFETNDDVIEYRKANDSNLLVISNLVPEVFNKTHGLRLISRYRVPGVVDPMYILMYKPQGRFVQYAGATAQDFMPANEMIMFSLSSTRYKVLRGVDVLGLDGRSTRAAGDVVFDEYTDKDPIVTYIRSQARYALIPAVINHTARQIGTFPVVS